MMGFMIIVLSLPIFDLGDDLCIQGIEMRINGCGVEYGS